MEWIMGLFGGLMIGCAGAAYLLVNGRIMGASGILGDVLDGSGRNLEQVAFLVGMVVVPALKALAIGRADTQVSSATWLLIFAGLLVGLGTRIGNGCTSDHWVCGISRLSPRGICATTVFIATGALAVAGLRSMGGL